MYVLLTLRVLAWIKVYNALKLALKLSPFSAFPTLGFESLIIFLLSDLHAAKKNMSLLLMADL